jgi:hypothetical protein
MPLSSHEPPPYAFDAVSFAENLAREYARRGGDVIALFGAYAGLVSARHKAIGTDCLIAVDRMLSGEVPKP